MTQHTQTSPKGGNTDRAGADRQRTYMNRRVKELLGSSYSWNGELYYIGNPCVAGATEYENKILYQIERNWHEAITS